jgi:mannose/fructose/N-acetylgalactosamine-specific phosphotransferase system component IID
VYLVVIAWMYVVLMMSVAEATNTTGTVLGAIVTFILYGLMPMGIVVYIMSTPARKRRIKAREATELAQANEARKAASDLNPDAGGHAPGATKGESIPPMGKEP